MKHPQSSASPSIMGSDNARQELRAVFGNWLLRREWYFISSYYYICSTCKGQSLDLLSAHPKGWSVDVEWLSEKNMGRCSEIQILSYWGSSRQLVLVRALDHTLRNISESLCNFLCSLTAFHFHCDCQGLPNLSDNLILEIWLFSHTGIIREEKSLKARSKKKKAREPNDHQRTSFWDEMTPCHQRISYLVCIKLD